MRKAVTYNGTPTRLLGDFSTENFQARKDWHKIFSDEKQ